MLGSCAVVIAAKNALLGMGEPAIVEEEGLSVYHTAEGGPTSFQFPNSARAELYANGEALLNASVLCAEYERQLGGGSPLSSLMTAKD